MNFSGQQPRMCVCWQSCSQVPHPAQWRGSTSGKSEGWTLIHHWVKYIFESHASWIVLKTSKCNFHFKVKVVDCCCTWYKNTDGTASVCSSHHHENLLYVSSNDSVQTGTLQALCFSMFDINEWKLHMRVTNSTESRRVIIVIFGCYDSLSS